MGNDPKRFVTNRFGQTHDVKNLFVADASLFLGCSDKTTTLSILAFRAAGERVPRRANAHGRDLRMHGPGASGAPGLVPYGRSGPLLAEVAISVPSSVRTDRATITRTRLPVDLGVLLDELAVLEE
jgi:hypothetical protein